MDESFRTLTIIHRATCEAIKLFVGNRGTIIRLGYTDRAGCVRKERVLESNVNAEGRCQVNLQSWDGTRYQQWNLRRYQLVAMAWHGYEPGRKGWELHHIDGDPANDAADNLVQLTSKEHKQVHRLLRAGFDPHQAVAEVLMARGDDDRDDLAAEAVA